QYRTRWWEVSVDRGLGPRPGAAVAVEQYQQPLASRPGESRCQFAGDTIDPGPGCRCRVVTEQPEVAEYFRQPRPGHIWLRPGADLTHRHLDTRGNAAEDRGDAIEHAAECRRAPAPCFGELPGVRGGSSYNRVFRG